MEEELLFKTQLIQRDLVFKCKIASFLSWLCVTLAESLEIMYVAVLAYSKLVNCRTTEV